MSDSNHARTAVLVDPHPLWLEAVSQILEPENVSVVATATSFAAGKRLVVQHTPDLLVAEVSCEDGVDGIAWLQEISALSPSLRIIVLALRADEDYIDGAFRAGAVAYVLKTANPTDLAAVIRHSFDASIHLPRVRDLAPVAPVRELHGVEELTRRELEILRLVAEGHSNAKLAKMLWVTEQTVKFHLSNIYRKLDVANRTEASRWAQLHGVLPADRLEAVGAA